MRDPLNPGIITNFLTVVKSLQSKGERTNYFLYHHHPPPLHSPQQLCVGFQQTMQLQQLATKGEKDSSLEKLNQIFQLQLLPLKSNSKKINILDFSLSYLLDVSDIWYL